VTTRFTIDLMHPGKAQRPRGEWFVGTAGVRHLGAVAAVGVALLAAAGLGGLLPQYLRSSSELAAVNQLKRDVKTAETELTTLQGNLKDLGTEARRQVRWSELLPVLTQRVPETLKLDRVALVKEGRQGRGQTAAQASEPTLQINASTAATRGSAALEHIATFMGSLAQDPVVASRFQLKTWDLRSSPSEKESEGLLQITIGFADKRS